MTVTEGEDEHALLRVMRTGCLDGTLAVQYATRDGTATSGADFVPSSGTIEFGPGETARELRIEILDDDEIEDDEEFTVELSAPSWAPPEAAALALGAKGGGGDGVAAEGAASKGTGSFSSARGALAARPVHAHLAGPRLFASCAVVIKDDDVKPGTLRWRASAASCVESQRSVTLVVERRRGHNGEVGVQYDTRQQTALEGVDFRGAHGTLTFAHEEMSKTITIDIIDDTSYEKEKTFLVVLSEPTDGARFPADTDGQDEREICTVTIQSDTPSPAISHHLP